MENTPSRHPHLDQSNPRYLPPEIRRQNQILLALTDDPSILKTHIPAPRLCFNDKPQRLEHLITSHPPVCVIKCADLPGSGKNVFQSNFDIRQPLLAYMTRTVRKVSAYSLSFDNQRHEFVPVGNGILIPEDYPGWFAVMGSPNTEIKHQSVSHYTKLSLLATSKCSHFLIGGKDPISGVMVQNDEKGRLRTTPCSVLPGTVLRKAGLYREEIQATKDKRKKKKGKDVPQREFLKCFDEHDREMLVYTRQTGAFYIVARDQEPVSPRVLQMKDILRYKLPLIVKLIYGRVPTTQCVFTQVLLLADHGVSRTLIASTLSCFRNINLEIPLGTDLKFYVAKDTAELLSSKAYIRALGACKEQAPSYVKDMKVVFGNSQLEPSEVTRLTTKTNQQEKLTQNNQPLPGCKLPVYTAKFPGHELQRPSSDSITSRLPGLSQMSEHVVPIDDTFVIADHSASSQTTISGKGDTTPVSPGVNSKMSPVKLYVPPQHPAITGLGLHPPQAPPGARPRVPPVYDNNPLTQHYTSDHKARTPGDQFEPTSNLQSGSFSSSPSSSVVDCSNQDDANIYWHVCGDERIPTIREDKRISTIKIPSKVGQPINPGKSPVDDGKQLNYISMQSKPAGPAPKPHLRSAGLYKATSTSPSTSEAPQIPPRDRIRYNPSESSSTNDSDSFTSLSEDSWSLSDWTTDEECNSLYVNVTDLKRVETSISENDTDHDQQLSPSEDDSPPYLELENVLDPVVPYSQLQLNDPMDLSKEFSGYLDPLDVYYQKSREEETGEHKTDPGYTTPDKRPDSGVYDDEPGGYCMVTESDPSDREHQLNVPQLPPRLPPPQLMTLGQAVLRSVPAPSKFAFTELTKEMLLLELRKSAIKPHTEMALVGLQMADIVNLLSKDDNFDDDLFALLPQVGTIDLKKIAKCLREMKFRK